ncbi:hypothetical protein QL285_034358 [Trifolium repens]|nr:hypothetical protein QL285_034358 [Trifolium repens]
MTVSPKIKSASLLSLSSCATAPPPHPHTHRKSFERSTTTTTTRLSPPAATFSLSLLDRTTFLSLSLSARPIFKAISPDLKNAATDRQDKSFVYLLLPFVSQSLFSRQRWIQIKAMIPSTRSCMQTRTSTFFTTPRCLESILGGYAKVSDCKWCGS